jgi:hypothetical protein
VTFELRARDGGGACTVVWTEIGTSPQLPQILPPAIVRDGARLVYRFDAVETDAARLVAAATALRALATSARAERYG